MMKNYERYLKTSAEEYDRKTVMALLCRVLPDRKIIPLLCGITGKKVLDAGLGTGHYTRILMENNYVVGIDRNPHLCKLPIKLYEGDATEITKIAGGEKFDVVFSTWMTEYLNEEQLGVFFSEAKKVLNKGGKLITTVISRYGLGAVYITLAKVLRGIDKYNYRKGQIVKKLETAGFGNIQIIRLNSWLWVPWAYMVIAQ